MQQMIEAEEHQLQWIGAEPVVPKLLPLTWKIRPETSGPELLLLYWHFINKPNKSDQYKMS